MVPNRELHQQDLTLTARRSGYGGRTSAFTRSDARDTPVARARGSDEQEQERGATFGRGPQPARPGPAWRPGTRPPVTRKPLGRRAQDVARPIFIDEYPFPLAAPLLTLARVPAWTSNDSYRQHCGVLDGLVLPRLF